MKKHIVLLTILVGGFFAGPVLSQQEQKAAEGGAKSGGPNGYGQLQWGTTLSAAKEKVEGKITFVDEKRIIVSKDGDIEYRYGFFYKEPAPEEGNAKKPIESEKKGGEQPSQKSEAGEAKLYFVLVRFPYLPMEEVKKKIEEKYGPYTGETLKNNRGAIIWDYSTTTIVLWVDNYEKSPFCRKITYIGKEIAKEVNDYQVKVFTDREREILRKLSP